MTAKHLILLCCFVTPWFYGLVEIAGQPIAFVDLLLPFCIVAWLMQRTHNLSGLGVALLAFGVAALLSVVSPLAAGQPASALFRVARLWGIILPAVLLSPLRCTREDWVDYLRAFFFGGLASLVVGIAGFFLQWDPIVATQTYIYDGGAYMHRAGGVFRDSGAYGHLLATWVAVSLLLLAPELSTWWRQSMSLLVLVVTALGLYASVSRSAALNIGTVLLLGLTLRLPWSSGAAGMVKRVLGGTIVLVFASLALLLVGSDSEGVLQAASDTVTLRLTESFTALLGGFEDIERASGGRLTTWMMALDAWSSAPVLGVGYKMLVLNGNPPDNTFVLALCETGMLGFAALAFCFGSILWRAADQSLKRESDGTRFLVLWFGQFVHSLNADILTFFGSVPALLIITLIWFRLASAPARESVARLAQRQRGMRVEAAHSAHLGAR